MQITSQDYRARATKLRDRADEIDEPSIKSRYLKLADYWDRLAVGPVRRQPGAMPPPAAPAVPVQITI